MSNENLDLAAKAKQIADIAKKVGFGKPEILSSSDLNAGETRVANELLGLMSEHGFGIGLHKGVNAPDVKPIANGYTKMVEDTAKSHIIMNNAEIECGKKPALEVAMARGGR